MSKLLDRVGVASATFGVGTLTLASALASSTLIFGASWRTFAGAGAADGDIVSYLILDKNGAYEFGRGIYSAGTLARTQVLGSSNGNALINCSGDAQVFVTALAEDLQVGVIRKPTSGTTVTVLSTDIEVGIDTRSTAVTAVLPSAVLWAMTNRNGLELALVDYYGNAFTNNITPSLFAGDSFNWTGVPVINGSFGSLKLRPDPSLPGWVVRGLN